MTDLELLQASFFDLANGALVSPMTPEDIGYAHLREHYKIEREQVASLTAEIKDGQLSLSCSLRLDPPAEYVRVSLTQSGENDD
jgi:hypothetical protein